jgi:hypothetical protein
MNKLFLLLIGLISIQSYSQNGLTEIPLAPVDSTEHYLAHKYVHHINSRDNKIYLAFRYGGVNAFDGLNWTKYTSLNCGIPSDETYHISFSDSMMYVSTNAGLGVYDGSTWQVVNMSSGLPNDTVLACTSNQNTQFIISGIHLTVMDSTGINSFSLPEVTATGSRARLALDDNGNLWIGLVNKGLFFFNGDSVSKIQDDGIFSLAFINEHLRVGRTDELQYLKNGIAADLFDVFDDGYLPNVEYPIGVNSIYEGSNGHLFFTIGNSLNEVYQDQIKCYSVHGVDRRCQAVELNGLIYLVGYNTSADMLIELDLNLYNDFEQDILHDMTNGPDYSNTKALDINNVKASVHTSGSLFWDLGGTSKYEVPKGSGKTSTFAEGVWIGGYDSQKNLHISALKFNDGEFWPGPILDPNDTTSFETANEYDQVWKVDREMIEEYRFMFDLGAVTDGSYFVPFDIVSWPGDHPTTGAMMAPYFDYNNDGYYNYMDGDYPLIKGDQMLWWVMNDFIAKHELSGGAPLKVEIYASYYAFLYENAPNDSLKSINNYTFMHYDFVNRSGSQYDSCFISYKSDYDLGYAFDDYTGCNVDLNCFYVYNGLSIDGTGQANAYGGPTPSPPVYSINFLKGPLADEGDGIDNDKDFETDEVGECCELAKFMKSTCGGSGPLSLYQGDPQSFYNFMRGCWSDGTNLMYGGIGHFSDPNSSIVKCDYLLPGASDPDGWGQNGQMMPEWSEVSEGNPEGDRRGLGSSGPFTLEPGETTSLDLAYIWTQFPDSAGISDNLNYHFDLTQDVIEWFNNDDFPSNYLFEIDSTAIVTEPISLEFKLYPNPARDIINIEIFGDFYSNMDYLVLDIRGRVLKGGTINANSVSAIDVQNLSTGSYFLQINHKQKQHYLKFIKQ